MEFDTNAEYVERTYLHGGNSVTVKNSGSVDVDVIEARVAGHHVGRLEVGRSEPDVAPVLELGR